MTKKKLNLELVGRGIVRLSTPDWTIDPMQWYYDRGIDPDGEYETCPVCGCEMSYWEDCWNGCDDGWITDLYESDPLWYDEDDIEMCPACSGKGGWWICTNLPHKKVVTDDTTSLWLTR